MTFAFSVTARSLIELVPLIVLVSVLLRGKVKQGGAWMAQQRTNTERENADEENWGREDQDHDTKNDALYHPR